MSSARRTGIRKVVLALFWILSVQRWQRTHTLKDDGTSYDPPFDASCCVCFESFSDIRQTCPPPPQACPLCGSLCQACESCLRAWSFSSGSVKRCVVCQRGGGGAGRSGGENTRPFPDLLPPYSNPLTCFLSIASYILLYYSCLLTWYGAARQGAPLLF